MEVGQTIIATLTPGLAALGVTLSSAGEGPGPLAAMGGWLLSNALALTILFVLLSAVISAIIRYRRRDRVLKDFDGYHAVVVLADGRRIWGNLQVYPNGLEIHYDTPVADPSGHVERSFVLHQGELAAVRAILRPRDMLSPAMVRRRRRDIIRYVRPSLGRRILRFLAIQISILRDALVQTFSLVVGHARTVTRPASKVGEVLQTQDRHINEIGRTVISSVNLAYDPILESFFGQGCVVDVPEEGRWREIPGTLKEYSPDWLELLRASWPERHEIRLPAATNSANVVGREVTLGRNGTILTVRNGGKRNVEVLTVQADGVPCPLDGAARELLPGQIGEYPLPAEEGELHVTLLCLQPGDLIVPRSTVFVRHRLAQQDLTLLENLGIRRGGS